MIEHLQWVATREIHHPLQAPDPRLDELVRRV